MTVNQLPVMMLICLISTILAELIFAIILKVREKIDILNIILVNIFTNPIVTSVPVYIDYCYGVKYRNISLLILEILVILVEGFIYKKVLNFKRINPFILSMILNIISIIVGLIIGGIV